jgi:hypothetical protein
MSRPSQESHSLQELEELMSQDPRALRIKCGVPHPLSHFGTVGFDDGLLADIILDFIHDTVWEEPESPRCKGAVWFLLESERAYFFACTGAGIDGSKLRSHLRKCRLASQSDCSTKNECSVRCSRR